MVPLSTTHTFAILCAFVKSVFTLLAMLTVWALQMQMLREANEAEKAMISYLKKTGVELV